MTKLRIALAIVTGNYAFFLQDKTLYAPDKTDHNPTYSVYNYLKPTSNRPWQECNGSLNSCQYIIVVGSWLVYDWLLGRIGTRNKDILQSWRPHLLKTICRNVTSSLETTPTAPDLPLASVVPAVVLIGSSRGTCAHECQRDTTT